MSEKVRFHSMTKPIKFRRLKLLKMYVSLWCKALRERILYFFNYILYKLNILKRYSYRDNVGTVIPLPHYIKQDYVETQNFRGKVIMDLIEEKYFDIDYFFRVSKSKKRKRTLTLKDVEESRIFTTAHLEDISIKIGDRWYDTTKLPIVKVAIAPPLNVGVADEAPLEPLKYETVNYTTMPIRSLIHRNFIGIVDLRDVSPNMIDYYYDVSCREFKKQLEYMNLSDLKVGD